MANRKILLGLLVLCLSLYLTECGRFGGRSSSRGSSRGGSSWGKGWGGSSSSSSSWGSGGSSYKPSTSWNSGSSSGSSWGSSGSSYKPSSSWNTGSSSGSSWGSSSSGSHKYPSSGSGLSGYGTSGSSGSHGYPSSGSGLSGFGSSGSSGSHGYPSSGTGLSGFGSSGSSGSYGYPSSGSGLSGFGSSGSSGSHKYPSSGSGLSGSSSSGSYGSHSYPSSGSGLSGSGSSRNPSSSSGSHSSGSGSYYQQKHNYNTNTGFHSSGASYVPHTYYSAPQHIYVTQYRNSDSRYNDLLTGLTLYNLGRSHTHYHDHYYYDDYYRNRYPSSSYYGSNTYGSSSGGYNNNNRPKNEAICTLRIKENGKLEVLKIPCEIVSTFTEGKKIENDAQLKPVCTTNITVIKNTTTTSSNETSSTSSTTTAKPVESTTLNPMVAGIISGAVEDVMKQYPDLAKEFSDIFSIPKSPVSIQNSSKVAAEITPTIIKTNETVGNKTIETVKVITATEQTINTTTCITPQMNFTDPLAVKGASVDASKLECSVDIRTKDAHLRNEVNCMTLMEFAKMPEPKKDKPLLPPREKLKSWLQNPPWWLATFIAV